MGSPPDKGGGKKKKKTLVLALGSSPEKAEKKKKKKPTSVGFAIENLCGRFRHRKHIQNVVGHTHAHTVCNYVLLRHLIIVLFAALFTSVCD